METTIQERIRILIQDLKGGSQKAFAEAIGVKPSTLNQVVGIKNSRPGSETLQRILNTFQQVNSDWLVIGIGEKYREEEVEKSNGEFSNDVIKDLAEEIRKDYREQIQHLRKANDSLHSMLQRSIMGKKLATDSRRADSRKPMKRASESAA